MPPRRYRRGRIRSEIAMAFMMPVMKNEWDIYHSQRTRRASESGQDPRTGRSRKISETRSEGPGGGSASGLGSALGSPHRSAPAMRCASYGRVPPSRASRASLRATRPVSPPAPPPQQQPDKFHTRLVDKLKRALCKNQEGRTDERSS